MSMTIKKLIAELEKVDNKFIEVEIYHLSEGYLPISKAIKVDKKFLIITDPISNVHRRANRET